MSLEESVLGRLILGEAEQIAPKLRVPLRDLLSPSSDVAMPELAKLGDPGSACSNPGGFDERLKQVHAQDAIPERIRNLDCRRTLPAAKIDDAGVFREIELPKDLHD